MPVDALIEEINAAYRRLETAAEELARTDRELTDHVRRVRLDNVEAILDGRYRSELTARKSERGHRLCRFPKT